jgi:hypothetical protein
MQTAEIRNVSRFSITHCNASRICTKSPPPLFDKTLRGTTRAPGAIPV